MSDEPEPREIQVNTGLPADVHAKLKLLAASQNRSMAKMIAFLIKNAVDPARLAPVIKMPPSVMAAVPKPVAMVSESDIRRIVRHELSYLMPDQYERRYGKGEPS